MKCTSCGETLKDGVKFCPKCGQRSERVCPKCERILKPGARFCSFCGTSVLEDKIDDAKEKEKKQEQDENLNEQKSEKEGNDLKNWVCYKCGSALKATDAFCKECGAKQDKRCPNCGARIKEEAKFCSHCGKQISQENGMIAEEKNVPASNNLSVAVNAPENIDEIFDSYRNRMLEKSKKEKIMIGGVLAISIAAVLAYYVNNEDFMEALIAGAIIGGVTYVIYGIVAGSLEVYEATVYLKKYDSIKESVGKKEAIIFIEKEYRPKEKGILPMLTSIKMTGGCLGGCLQVVASLATSIIGIILAMAFC